MEMPKQMDQGQPAMQQQGEMPRQRRQEMQQQAGARRVEPQAGDDTPASVQITDWAAI